jgi:putative transposase
MTDKFKNKYRRESTRLQNWDYGNDAVYFITICTAYREKYFGEITTGIMNLSPIGIIATDCWYDIKNHAHNIELGEFKVMPNHIHGILVLNRKNNGFINFVDTRRALHQQSQSTRNNKTDQNKDQSDKNENNLIPSELTIGQKRFQNQGKNTVSSIIGSYKSAVTKLAHRAGFEFAWQSRFYDHIIRDEKSFYRITQYIRNNPTNWKDDDFMVL